MHYRIHAVFLSVGFIVALAFSGCASQQSAVVATIGGENVTLDEFNAMYEKSNGGKEAAQKATVEDREKFLDLYVTFKLKVLDAYAHGYQHDPDIQAELQQYRHNLAVAYLINKEITEPSLRRLYAQRSVAVRASHILIHLPSNPIPPDTLRAYQKAIKILDSLKNGRSFEELALNNSDDPSVKNNKGDLYYFAAGMMVQEFEDAALLAPPGAVVPYPVRTQFGYHIVKITASEPNRSIHVSHIMKRLSASSTHDDSAKAVKDLETVLDSLKQGIKFADLAREHSDDTFSKQRGGDLGFITRRKIVKEFDEVAFNLKVGEVSGIVKTAFGLHLIQVTEVKPAPSFESMEQDLKSFYQANRFHKDYDWYVAGLKKEYNFLQSPEAVSAWRASLDTTKTTGDSSWDSSFSKQTRAKDLFSFAGRNVTIDSVIHCVKADQELQGLPLAYAVNSDNIFDKVSKTLLVGFKAETMESTFPDFAKTIKEYEEGSMLFKAEQNAVWNKISVGDSAIHVYFEANRSQYTWPDRVNLQEIFVPTDSVAKVVTFLLKKQHLPFDSVAVQFNTRQSTKGKKGEWGIMPASSNALTERAWKMNEGEVSEFFPYENGYSIIRILAKDGARNKTFIEAGSELSSAFQEHESKLKESEWEESLRVKYPVKEFKEVLRNSADLPSNK